MIGFDWKPCTYVKHRSLGPPIDPSFPRRGMATADAAVWTTPHHQPHVAKRWLRQGKRRAAGSSHRLLLHLGRHPVQRLANTGPAFVNTRKHVCELIHAVAKCLANLRVVPDLKRYNRWQGKDRFDAPAPAFDGVHREKWSPHDSGSQLGNPPTSEGLQTRRIAPDPRATNLCPLRQKQVRRALHLARGVHRDPRVHEVTKHRFSPEFTLP